MTKELQNKCWTQVQRTERQQVQVTVPQEELTPLERTKKPKLPLSSSTQTRQNEVATPANLPPRKQGGWVQRLSGNTIAARTRKYEIEYKSEAELLLSTANKK